MEIQILTADGAIVAVPHMTDEELVDAASAWLDVRIPGWADKIHGYFNVNEAQCCVAGHLNRHLSYDVDYLVLVSDMAEDTGIHIVNCEVAFSSEELNPLWKAAIKERQTERSWIRIPEEVGVLTAGG